MIGYLQRPSPGLELEELKVEFDGHAPAYAETEVFLIDEMADPLIQ